MFYSFLCIFSFGGTGQYSRQERGRESRGNDTQKIAWGRLEPGPQQVSLMPSGMWFTCSTSKLHFLI